LVDVDGNVEECRGTVSVFNVLAPVVRSFNSQANEIEAVGAWLANRGKYCGGSRLMFQRVRNKAQNDKKGAKNSAPHELRLLSL
jgi:hypothetical protein